MPDHGPPPLTIDFHGTGPSARRWFVSSERGHVHATGVTIHAEAGKWATATLNLGDGHRAVYSLQPDFSVDGTLRLIRTEQWPELEPPRRPTVSEMLTLLNALVRLYSGGTLSMHLVNCGTSGVTIEDFETVPADEWIDNWAPAAATPVGG